MTKPAHVLELSIVKLSGVESKFHGLDDASKLMSSSGGKPREIEFVFETGDFPDKASSFGKHHYRSCSWSVSSCCLRYPIDMYSIQSFQRTYFFAFLRVCFGQGCLLLHTKAARRSKDRLQVCSIFSSLS